MSSLLSPSLPFLPTEVKKEILKFCDQFTLAKTSSLSLAFLQLSSPLLYRHIEFEGPEGLTKFLTLVAEKRHPEFDPWLDLSLVHSITYTDVKDHPFNRIEWKNGKEQPSTIQPRRLRLPSSSTPGRLPLHSLKVLLPADESKTRIHTFFNPFQFQLNGVFGVETSLLDVDISSWTRLQKLVLVNAFFSDVLPYYMLGRISIRGLRVFYDLSTSFSPAVVQWIGADLNINAADEHEEEMMMCIENVSVLVNTQTAKTRLLQRLGGSLLLPRITILVKSLNETAPNDMIIP